MSARAPYVVMVSLALMTIGLVSCRNSEDGAITSRRGTTRIQQCRAGSARPITVMTAMRIIRRNGFEVVAVRDEGICSAQDMIAVFDNTERRNWDTVLNTEGHINCGLRAKPIYRDPAIIVSTDGGNWYGYRFENLECNLEKPGAGSSINQRDKFRAIFDQLRRETIK